MKVKSRENYIPIDLKKIVLKNGRIIKDLQFRTVDLDAGIPLDKAKKHIHQIIKDYHIDERYNSIIVNSLNDVGWRSKEGFRHPNDVELYDPREIYDIEDLEEEPIVYGFSIILTNIEKTGGNNKNNNCLYKALLKMLQKLPWKYPSGLKKFLNLEKSEKVHYKLMPLLEDKLRVKINIIGDVNYISGKEYKQEITLKLKNGHYTPKYDYDNYLITKSFKPLPHDLIVYNKIKGVIYCYNGKETYIEDEKDFREKQMNFFKHQKHLVRCKDENLEEYYKKYRFEAIQLEKKGFNLLDFPSLKRFVLYLLYWNLHSYNAEPLTKQEEEFHRKANNGAFINAVKGEYENIKCYDINSMYPSIMANKKFSFPIKRGEFKIIDELPETLNYGIYRCKCTSDIDRRVFKLNKNNYYTHYELNLGRSLGYKFEMIKDGGANILLYNAKNRVWGSCCFGDYMKKLYELKIKYKKNSLVKMLLNIVWGALCEKQLYNQDIKDDEVVIENSRYIHPDNKSSLRCIFSKEKYFKTSYARLGVFLLSYGKKTICEIMNPIKDKVYRAHTDGFICDGSVDLKISDELGGLKIEYTKRKINVVNVNLIKKYD